MQLKNVRFLFEYIYFDSELKHKLDFAVAVILRKTCLDQSDTNSDF